MNQLVNYKYYIGIDVGTNTGMAIWSKDDHRFIYLVTAQIHQAMEMVKTWSGKHQGIIKVRVEDPRLATYGRQNDYHKAQGAGSVKRDASIWEDFLTDLEIDFEMVRPNNKTTKLSSDAFKKITGHSNPTSNHARDAGMLVFGF